MIRLVAAIAAGIGVAAAGGASVLHAYGAWRLARAEARFEAEVGPLDPAAYDLPPVAPEENASRFLREGAALVQLTDAERARVFRLAGAAGEAEAPSGDDRAFLGALLERHAAALAVLHRAAGMTRSTHERRYGAEILLTPEWERSNLLVRSLLDAVRLLAAEARYATWQAASDRFVDAAGALAALAVSLEGEPDLVSLLLGTSAERLLVGRLAGWTASARDIEALPSLASLIPETDLAAGCARAFALDRAWLKAQARAGKPTSFDHRTTAAGPVGRAWAQILDWTAGDIRHAGFLGKIMATLKAMSHPVAAGEADPRDEASWLVDILGMRSKLAAPNLRHVTARLQGTLSQRLLARRALAVLDHAVENGAYPESLDRLDWSAEPDPFTGERPAYERLPDGGVRLAVPGGADAWARLMPRTGGTFSWNLPPLS